MFEQQSARGLRDIPARAPEAGPQQAQTHRGLAQCLIEMEQGFLKNKIKTNKHQSKIVGGRQTASKGGGEQIIIRPCKFISYIATRKVF